MNRQNKVRLCIGTLIVLSSCQVSWGFNSMELRQAISSSSFLTSLTVALGAQICDHDLQLLASSCPYLEHLTLSFQHVTDEGDLVSSIPSLVYSERHIQGSKTLSGPCYADGKRAFNALILSA